MAEFLALINVKHHRDLHVQTQKVLVEKPTARPLSFVEINLKWPASLVGAQVLQSALQVIEQIEDAKIKEQIVEMDTVSDSQDNTFL